MIPVGLIIRVSKKLITHIVKAVKKRNAEKKASKAKEEFIAKAPSTVSSDALLASSSLLLSSQTSVTPNMLFGLYNFENFNPSSAIQSFRL